jgi:hypothetical protein
MPKTAANFCPEVRFCGGSGNVEEAFRTIMVLTGGIAVDRLDRRRYHGGATGVPGPDRRRLLFCAAEPLSGQK